MKKLTILIDMDDTIEDLLGAWVEYINSKYDMHVHKNDIKEWEIGKAFPGLTKEQIFEPLFDDEFWETVKPVENAQKFVEQMFDDGHDIYIVTCSHYKTIGSKVERVLFRYFPFIDCDHIIVASHKQMIRGDVLIDDAPHNVCGGEYKGILFTVPHNENFNAEKNGVIRVHGWDEVYKEICNMQEGKQYE